MRKILNLSFGARGFFLLVNILIPGVLVLPCSGQSVYPAPYTFHTLAGQVEITGTNDGVGSSAEFRDPWGLALDSGSNVYVADTYNCTIRKVSPAGGSWVVSTLAGQGGLAGTNDGMGFNAQFNDPMGMAVDGAGNLYVADTYNYTIRKVSPVGPNWVVTTLVGQAGTHGTLDGTNSGALLYQPTGIAVDSATNLYVTDPANSTVRKVSPMGGNWVITTLADNPAFIQPSGIAVDGGTNLYVSDLIYGTISRMSRVGATWVVTTLAGQGGILLGGSSDGIGANAQFSFPSGVAVDGVGNIYVTDEQNDTIRKVSPVGTNWVVTTLAGRVEYTGYRDGTGSNAWFELPNGVASDSAGNLYVADTFNSVIRAGVPSCLFVQFPSNIVVSTCSNCIPVSYSAVVTTCCSNNVTVDFEPPSGTCFDPGTNTVEVTVTDGCTNVVTGSFTVTVIQNTPTVTISAQGTSSSGTSNSYAACSGQSVTFSAIASGGQTNPLSYQWKLNQNYIAGASSPTYTIPSLTAGDASTYCVDVASACGVIEQCVTLSVLPALTVVCPANKTVQCGNAWMFDMPTASSCCGTNVNIFPIGTVSNGVCPQVEYTQSWLISDGCGDSNICSQMVTVIGCCSNSVCDCSAGPLAEQSFQTLYSFTNGTDGAFPQSTLIISGNTLYGTAFQGGNFSAYSGGGGTVFSIQTDGSMFTTLHAFAGPPGDGANTQTGVTLLGNMLYGVTADAYNSYDGTVFELGTNGAGFTTIYTFSGTDGAHPYGGLTAGGKFIYGTTAGGGGVGDGTIFSIHANGQSFSSLNSFTGVSGDGDEPLGQLVLSGGTLYGTTGDFGINGAGTIFAIQTDGLGYQTLYDFGGIPGDGKNPISGLVVSGSTLYGTTIGGGSGGGSGGGTVFAIQTDGSGYTILHSFSGLEGQQPYGGLILSYGTLIGTTQDGGEYGGGTIYALRTDGSGFTTIHNFGPGDGNEPLGGLVLSGNTLYGTTMVDGASDWGTVFASTLTNLPTNCLQIECPGDLAFSVTNCAQNVQEFYAPIVTDPACSNWTVVCTPPSGSYFAPNITTTVSCVANDCCGNTATCSFTITIACSNCCSGCTPPYPDSYTVTIYPGSNFLADDLCQGTNNTLASVVTNAPARTSALFWNGAVQGFTTDEHTAAGWENGTEPLIVGTGFILISPSVFTLTVSGCAPDCPVPCAPPNGFSLVGGSGTGPTTWSNWFSCSPPCGTTVMIWNPTNQQFSTDVYANGVWSPQAPVLGVGQSAWVNVNTNLGFVVTCPTNKTVSCGSEWAFDTPTATTCCGSNAVIIPTSTVTNSFCPFVITRTWFITDVCGDSNTCSQVVTVMNTNPPQINCPGNIEVSVTNCTTNIPVCYLVTAIDPCTGINLPVVLNPPSCSFFAPGTTSTVICTATNCNGMSNSCSFTVTVNCCTNLQCCGPNLGLQTINWLELPTSGNPNPDPLGNNSNTTWFITNLPCYGNVLVTQDALTNILLSFSKNPSFDNAPNNNGGFNFPEAGYGPYQWGVIPGAFGLNYTGVYYPTTSMLPPFHVNFYFLDGPPNPCNLVLGCIGLSTGTTNTISQPVTFRAEYDLYNYESGGGPLVSSSDTMFNGEFGVPLEPGVTGTVVTSADTNPTGNTDKRNTGWALFQPTGDLQTTTLPPGSGPGWPGSLANVPYLTVTIAQDPGDGFGLTVGYICCTNCRDNCLQVQCPPAKTVQCGSGWTFDLPVATTCCTSNIITSNGVATNVVITSLGAVTNGLCPLVITQMWLVTDACGDSNTCSQVVTVMNTNPPQINCPENIEVSVTNCTTNVPVCYFATAVDPCTGVNLPVVLSPPSCSFFAPGTTTTVYCTATNCSGMSNTCSFTVTVNCCTNLQCCGPNLGLRTINWLELPTSGNLSPDPLGNNSNTTWFITNLPCYGNVLITQDALTNILLSFSKNSSFDNAPNNNGGFNFPEAGYGPYQWGVIPGAFGLNYTGTYYPTTSTLPPFHVNFYFLDGPPNPCNLVLGCIGLSADTFNTISQPVTFRAEYDLYNYKGDGGALVSSSDTMFNNEFGVPLESGVTGTSVTSADTNPTANPDSRNTGWALFQPTGDLQTTTLPPGSGPGWPGSLANVPYLTVTIAQDPGDGFGLTVGYICCTNCPDNCLQVQCPLPKTVQCGSGWTFDLPVATTCCAGMITTNGIATNVVITSLGAVTNGLCPLVITQMWLVTDACGDSNTCSQVVTVDNNNGTSLDCASTLVVSNGQAWSFTTPTASQACCTNLTITVLNTLTNVTCNPCSISYTRTWQLTDCCSNTSTCSQTVTVLPASPCQTFNTGVNALGTLAGGTTDPNFVLVSEPAGLQGGSALVINPADLPLPYFSDGPNSQWIGPNAASGNEPPGVYHYQLYFLMCCTNTAELSGQMAADDVAGIYLNGVHVEDASGFGNWTPIEVTNGFVACPALNVLDVYVTNAFGIGVGGANPTAFRAELAVCVLPLSVFCSDDKTVPCDTNWTFDPPAASSCCSTNVIITPLGAVTNGTCPKAITQTWLVADGCGNFAVCDQTVTVVPVTPTLVCAGNKTVVNGLAWSFDPPVATNACCSNLTICVLNIVTNVTCSPCAINYTCTWQVTDCCTNSATCSQTVTVYPTTPCQVFNSGMNGPAVLPGGVMDPNFRLVGYPDGALVINTTNLAAGYLADGPDSQWIGPDAYSDYEPSGVYHYQFEFLVCCTNQAQLSGRMAADNTAGVYLNGVEVASIPASAGAASWTSINVTHGLLGCPSLNVLDIYVTNYYSSLDPLPSSPTGFRAELTNCASPLVVTCPTNKTEICGTVWSFDVPHASSCCDPVDITTNSTVTNSICPMYITRTWQITDNCGDAATCSQVVTLKDTSRPVIECTNGVMTVPLNANCDMMVPLIHVTATDDCAPGSELVTIQHPAANTIFANTRNVEVTVIVSNTCNSNVSLPCTVDVEAQDEMPPVLSGPTNLVITNCEVPCVTGLIHIVDACCPSNMLQISQSPMCNRPLGPGDTSVTVTVKDCNSRQSTWVIQLIATDATQTFLGNLYNTGVDNNHVQLAYDAVDPHYLLPTTMVPPGLAGAVRDYHGNAVAVSQNTVWYLSPATTPCGPMQSIAPGRYIYTPWALTSPASRWIAPDYVNNICCLAGDYTYALTFNLPAGAEPSTASIQGRWACDSAGKIYLNGTASGNLVSSTSPGLLNASQQWNNFTIPPGSSFLPANTLYFVVYNEAQWTGLRVEFTSATIGCSTCAPPSIVTAPLGQTLPVGSMASFNVNASGTPPLYYQWYFNGAPISNNGPDNGANSAGLTVKPVSLSNAGLYTVVVSNACGSVSNSARLVVSNRRPLEQGVWDVAQLANPLAATIGPDLILIGDDYSTNYAISSGSTEDFGLPEEGGQVVNTMDIAPLPPNTTLQVPLIAPAGTSSISAYTVIMDVYEPDTSFGTPGTLFLSDFDCCHPPIEDGQDGTDLTVDAQNFPHITSTSGGALYDTATAAPLPVDAWNRLVLTESILDPMNVSVSLYVNGSPAASMIVPSQTGLPINWSNSPPSLFSSPPGVTAEYYVSSIQFLDVALGSDQVAGLGSPDDGPAPVNDTVLYSPSPVLTAAVANGVVSISWTGSPYVLQETSDLSSGQWVDSEVTFTESQVNGDIYTTAVAAPSTQQPSKFYRLTFRP